MKFRKKYLLLPIPVISLLYLFWGPLFPWSPLKPGYQRIKSSKADIFISDMTPGDSAVYRIEEIIKEEEEFHGLRYKDDFTVIVLNEESNMKRYLPWLKGNGYSVSLGIADLVYIGPNARRSSAGIEPFLKHELSHLLIDQNTSYDKSEIMHGQAWLVEGIAEYFSGHVFLSKDEFLELASSYNFDYNIIHEGNPLRMSLVETKLNYTHYRLFIEFLVDGYGIEKLRTYLKEYIRNPEEYKKIFAEVYSLNLEELLEEFSLSLE